MSGDTHSKENDMTASFVQSDIVHEKGMYTTFPSVAKMKDGRLLLVYRQAKDRLPEYGKITHVDPSARIMMRTSSDKGKTWSGENVLYDDEMGEQDPCVTCLTDGTLICTFFRWKVVPKELKATLGRTFDYYGRIVFDKWAAIHIGTMCLSSEDNGKTWDGPYPLCNSNFEGALAMRGNIVEYENGQLLAPLYGIKQLGSNTQCLILQSKNRGRSWNALGEIPKDEGLHFFEPFLYKSPSGRLIIFMRTHRSLENNAIGPYENLHCSVSDDGGKIWSKPVRTELYCPNPVHVLEYEDRLLFTYGQRNDPKGIEAVITEKENPKPSSHDVFVLRSLENADDLGYPWAVRTDKTSVLIVYYLTDKDNRTSIGATRATGPDFGDKR
jgi:hypothetical protein